MSLAPEAAIRIWDLNAAAKSLLRPVSAFAKYQRASIAPGLFLFGRHGEAKDRRLPLTCDVKPADSTWVRQIQSLAMLASINFSVRSPGLLGITAGLLHHIGAVEPSLQMSAAELAFGIFLVTGALSDFLSFHFVMRKLLWSCCFDRRQRSLSSSLRPNRRWIHILILLEGVSARIRQPH